MTSSENGEKSAATSYVVDASAFLALVLGEPGAANVESALAIGATISSVNLAEVVTRLVRDDFSEEQIRAMLVPFGLRIAAFEVSTAWSAGLISRQTKAFGLSLGDRACLALASELRVPALTAERIWANLDVGVDVVLCR